MSVVDLSRERDRRLQLLTMHIDITGEALRRLTPAQRDTLIVLTRDAAWTKVEVYILGDLGPDWIAFTLHGPRDGVALYGGIGPDGDAHT